MSPPRDSETLSDGLVRRGVLLDIPRLTGRLWLEPGEHVTRDELEAAESRQGVTVREGDILLVHTGHASRLKHVGTWETANAKSGVHPDAATFLADRRVARARIRRQQRHGPSTTERVDFPIHVLAINAIAIL